MGSAFTAILTVAILAAWHLRNRRRPGWSTSTTARFFITTGYPAVAIAVFWLSQTTDTHGYEWAFGNLWALTAMVMFVLGFNALRDAREQQKRASARLETLPRHVQPHAAVIQAPDRRLATDPAGGGANSFVRQLAARVTLYLDARPSQSLRCYAQGRKVADGAVKRVVQRLQGL